MKRVCPKNSSCTNEKCTHHQEHSFFMGCNGGIPCPEGYTCECEVVA